tara:strand:+ start:308 stop:790 length:483 start_codon:yes stop_codon:yes gene_type:complete
MAFAVEDGSIVTGANSYVTVAYADDYNTDRGNSDWTGSDAVKQAALIKATDYIEQEYAERFKGALVSDTQPLSWPRDGFIEPNYNEIPDKLKQAVCVLALEALANDLNPVLDRAVKREKVDVIEIEYMDNARESKSRPAINGLLRPLLNGSRYNVPVVRV